MSTVLRSVEHREPGRSGAPRSLPTARVLLLVPRRQAVGLGLEQRDADARPAPPHLLGPVRSAEHDSATTIRATRLHRHHSARTPVRDGKTNLSNSFASYVVSGLPGDMRGRFRLLRHRYRCVRLTGVGSRPTLLHVAGGDRQEGIMHCPGCQHDNPSASRFCNQCGMPVSGSPAMAGNGPTGAAVLTSLAALEGERKLVTVLFADLRGSLELVADRDPEDARQLLDPVLERLMAAVHRYEGTVNQVMGDGIMALFGAPVAHEDHALRACRSALLMQASMLDYAREVEARLGVAPRVRVGLHSGEVVVRAVGSDLRLDYTAVGETTHRAARMEQLAEPGTVLITEATARLVEGQLTLRPRGPRAIKGVRMPVDVWELLGPGPGHSRLKVAARRGLTALIGRATELATLHGALDELAAGRSQVVALVGEPGVGKSRLVWEFLAGARHRRWRVIEAEGRPHLRGLAYAPVVAVLRGLLDLTEDADATTVTVRLREALGPEAATRFLPPLAAMLDTPVDDVSWAGLLPAARRQRTLDALRYLLARPSAAGPLCLVMEDLHWIDSETQAVLEDLVGDLPPAPVLLLLTSRPDYEHGWTGKTGYAQVRVEPLSRPHADALAAALLGGEGTDELRSLLVERTEGNPFFVTTMSAPGPAPDSAPWPIGLITLGVKRTGKRRTGNPFAPFEVAGAGDGLTANLHGHAAGNGGHSQGEPTGHRASPRPYYPLMLISMGWLPGFSPRRNASCDRSRISTSSPTFRSKTCVGSPCRAEATR